MSEVKCPQCGADVVYDLVCHTWSTRTDDGREVWMACVGCSSAIGYDCTNCEWHYTDGLNSRNPRSPENERHRPQWLDGHELFAPPLYIVSAHPGADDAWDYYRNLREQHTRAKEDGDGN